MYLSNFEVFIVDNNDTRQDTSYELLITNLENIDIEFLLEIHFGKANLKYGYASAADLSVDIVHGDFVTETPMHQDAHEFVRSVYFIVPSKATTLVRLYQVISMQVQGYLALRVPPVRNPLHRFITMQQTTPINVLLAASRQDNFHSFIADITDENRKPVYKTFVNSQVLRQCILLASGKALNEIEPEGIGFATKVGEVAHLLELINAAEQGK